MTKHRYKITKLDDKGDGCEFESFVGKSGPKGAPVGRIGLPGKYIGKRVRVILLPD